MSKEISEKSRDGIGIFAFCLCVCLIVSCFFVVLFKIQNISLKKEIKPMIGCFLDDGVGVSYEIVLYLVSFPPDKENFWVEVDIQPYPPEEEEVEHYHKALKFSREEPRHEVDMNEFVREWIGVENLTLETRRQGFRVDISHLLENQRPPYKCSFNFDP